MKKILFLPILLATLILSSPLHSMEIMENLIITNDFTNCDVIEVFCPDGTISLERASFQFMNEAIACIKNMRKLQWATITNYRITPGSQHFRAEVRLRQHYPITQQDFYGMLEFEKEKSHSAQASGDE